MLISFSICELSANLPRREPPAKQTVLNDKAGCCQEAVNDEGLADVVIFPRSWV